MMTALLRIREFKIKQHYVDIINLDPKITLVTICDSYGRIRYSGHRHGEESLTDEENKKSLELAMNAWNLRGGLAQNREGMFRQSTKGLNILQCHLKTVFFFI
jgi:hypothetical protein